ncbi:MAG: energy-coupling factor ABC transporter permease [Lachnospiraceae bacterium]
MHMADALLAPAVATTMYVTSAAAAGISIRNLRKEEQFTLEPVTKKLPTMAVMSALVFAGQMINYTIPGTGSSGHLCGGMLLSALLGPYAGFLSMIVILTIQCLFFADGGLMALGANIWNMAFYGCFVGYFLIFRPILRSKLFAGSGEKAATRMKLGIAAVLGCIITLQLGAFSVVIETSLSGITELPFGAFVGLMQPIHLAIGLIEGLVTTAVLLFVYEARPELIRELGENDAQKQKCSFKTTIAILAAVVVVVGGGLSLLASSNPDGLEWSLFGNAEAGYSSNMGLDEENYGTSSTASDKAAEIQEKTAFLPDYAFASDSENALGTSASGIVGSAMVAAVAALVCFAGGFMKRKRQQ